MSNERLRQAEDPVVDSPAVARKKKKPKTPTLQIRDRIVDFRRVKGKDLLSNPNNWRMHSEEQRGVLRDLLGDIGIANALIARQTQSGKLEIIDGHLRQDTNPNIEWP